MPTFRAVCFDHSDTLFYADGPAALTAAALRLGVDLDADAATSGWTRVLAASAAQGAAQVRARDLTAAGHRAGWRSIFAAAGVVTAAGYADAAYDAYADSGPWRPFADTRAVLERLHELGIGVAIVSDTGWDIRSTFRANDLDDFVSGYVLSFEHGAVKPDVELYGAALELLGTRPGETLMVGDSPLRDGGAVAHGIAAYVLPTVASDPGAAPRGLAAVLALVGS